MKIRNGFVSNSSSSSFICAVSGGVEAGMDLCYSDAGFVQCENGHEFYEEYALPGYRDADDFDEYCLPERFCPICTLTHIRNEDVLAFLLVNNGIDRKELEQRIRAQFTDLRTLTAYLKAK